VPLNRWIEFDSAARQDQIDKTGSAFGITADDIVRVPHAPDVLQLKFGEGPGNRNIAVSQSLSPEEKLSAYALPAATAFASMTLLRQRKVSQYGLEASADDVFEALAHLIQLQSVWTVQGESAANCFTDFILNSPDKHLQPLQVFWSAMRESSQHIHLKSLTELFTWMLLGPWQKLMFDGHPAARYFQVFEWRMKAPEIFLGESLPENLFKLLDDATDSSFWIDNITEAAASADRRIKILPSRRKHIKGRLFRCAL